MRIALQNPFPNVPQVAEAEWIRRFFTACGRLGFEPVEVITSDDIMQCQPDCVLVTHENVPQAHAISDARGKLESARLFCRRPDAPQIRAESRWSSVWL